MATVRHCCNFPSLLPTESSFHQPDSLVSISKSVYFVKMSNRSRGSATANTNATEGDHRSTPPNIETMHSLKVDNLTYRTRVEDLRRYFDKFGPIGDIYIPRDQFSRSSRGYAFIRFVLPIDLLQSMFIFCCLT